MEICGVICERPLTDLYTRYPIVMRAIGLADACSAFRPSAREQKYISRIQLTDLWASSRGVYIFQVTQLKSLNKIHVIITS